MDNEMDVSASSVAPGYMDRLATGSGISLFLFALFLYGGCITGLVLKEPDICFLLGGGRWIVEHGMIPAADPFSYTTHYHWAPYVIEKWLTEVIFFSLEKYFGLTGLLIFDAALMTIAFVIIPYRIVYLCGWRGGAAMGIVFLTMLTSCSHLAVRPEVFSFVFAGIWLEVLIRTNAATLGNQRIQWRFIALVGLLMCLWSNMHTLFMFGIFLTGFYTVTLFVERFNPSLKGLPFNWTAPLLTLTCIVCSLINPWGFGLWTYMPNVFGPFNDTNNEMQPIGLRNWLNPMFFPFYILSFLSLKALAADFRKPLKHGDLFFRCLVPLGVLGGFKTIRSVPLAGLFLLTGRAALKSNDSLFNTQSDKSEIVSADKPEATSGLSKSTNPFSFTWPIVCILAASIGAACFTVPMPPAVPQASAAFKPPTKAIEYIERNRPSGNLLNDPHFGAVMIYKMRDNPAVFIDPRYNLYGNGILQDYWHMVKCDDNYQQLLDRYKIDWVFLPPKLELPKRLSTNQNWHLLYSDEASVIFARNQNIRTSQPNL